MGTRQSKSGYEGDTLVLDSNHDYGTIDHQTCRKSSTSSVSSSTSSSSGDGTAVTFRGTKSPTEFAMDDGNPEGVKSKQMTGEGTIITQEGNINFRGITRETKAKFMVMSDAVHGKQAWEQMESKWKVKPPSMILSVIGGARPFYLDDRIAASFRATILKTSQLPDACIITGGAYSGVMKMVGDALQETISAFSLGISTWNDIMNREVIIRDEVDSQYVVGSYLSQRGLYLDYQHTNFIIVEEDEKEENRDEKGQSKFRASLEHYMSRKGPSVLLVVNGGFGTLDFLYRYVKRVAGPVVIIQKSGRAADVIAFGLKHWDEIKAAKEQDKRHEELFSRMKLYMLDKDEETKDGPEEATAEAATEKPAETDNREEDRANSSSPLSTKAAEKDNLSWLDKYYDRLIACLEVNHLFTVAEVGSIDDIDTAVLNALIGNQSNQSTFEKLKLALWWERADFARSKILRNEPQVDDEHLEYLMINALARGDHEYVRLLMDYGVNMHELLTVKKLQFLYGYQACEDNFVLGKALKECSAKLRSGEAILERNRNAAPEKKSLPAVLLKMILNDVLCESFMANDVLIFEVLANNNPTDNSNDNSNDNHNDNPNDNSNDNPNDNSNDNPDDNPNDELKLKDPFWELFMWAVMCNKPKMADFLWSFGHNQMAKALIASEMFRVMSTMEGKFMQATVFLGQFAEFYKQAAYDLLDELSATNEVDTVKLCTSLLPRVPTMTCLDIAVKTKQYEFVAHNSVQMILADVWTGKIQTRKVKVIDYVKVLFSIIFPLLMTREEEDDNDPDSNPDSRRRSKKNFVYYAKEIHQFYFHTPILTFILHFFASFLFLVLYTYLVMTASLSVQKDPWQVLLIAYVIAHVIDEVYQITQYDTGSVGTKFLSWIFDEQNQFDLFNIIVFFVAWGLSFDARTLAYAHTVHAVNCGMWILRFSTILRVIPTIGLYLEMVSEMLRQLMWFLLILGVNVLAYGIASTAILHPGRQKPIVYLRMFLRSWFTIYGEYFLEIIPEEDNLTRLNSPLLNSYDEYVAWILLGAFLLITNILLLNIIIAAFNSTYSRIETRATHISKYRVYDLVVEYSKRVSTPPPLSIVHHIFLLFRWLLWKLTCNEFSLVRNTVTKLHRPPQSHDVERLRDEEYICAVRVYKGNTKGTEVLDYLNQDDDEDSNEEAESAVEKRLGEVLDILKDGGGANESGARVEELLANVEALVAGKQKDRDTSKQEIVERIEAMEARMCSLVEALEKKISLLDQKLNA